MGESTDSGRVALVTGAGRGIGLACAMRLRADGYRVGLLDVSEKALATARERCSGDAGAMLLTGSVARREDMQSAVDAVLGAFGRVDVLVNNAGINRPGDSVTQTDSDWAAVLDVNLAGPFVATSVVAPRMAEAGGAIVNIGSTGASGVGGSPAYVASKAGLIGLTRIAARDLGPRGIRVNLVAPGVTSSEWVLRHMGEESLAAAARSSPLRRVGTPEDVAAVVAFLASTDAAHVTGQVVSVSGGAWMP